MAPQDLVLPYGRVPYPLDLGGRPARVVQAGKLPTPRNIDELLATALARPIGSDPLEVRARGCRRVTLILSDATRREPRAAFLAALLPRLDSTTDLTLAIATGTHGPSPLEPLGIPADLLARVTLVNHDGHSPRDLVELGTTTHGTPVRVHRCLVDTDLVIATGCIRPHYFAGFGAGSKALFPGLGEATAIRKNHELKTAPRSHAGIVDGNPCRDDLAEAVRFIATPIFLCNGVVGPDGNVHAAVAGDLDLAFRAGVALARPWFTIATPPADLVIASDALPVTASLYQAAKIAAAAAPIVKPGGTLAVVAECADGIEPLHTVNEAIFRIGVLPRLAPNVSLELVSSLDASTVARTLLQFAPSVEAILARRAYDSITILPHASSLLLEPSS